MDCRIRALRAQRGREKTLASRRASSNCGWMPNLGWILLACCGCQACSDCCDYLPPVAGGSYGPPGIRAGSSILNSSANSSPAPNPSSVQADPLSMRAPQHSATVTPEVAHLTRLAPVTPVSSIDSEQPVHESTSDQFTLGQPESGQPESGQQESGQQTPKPLSLSSMPPSGETLILPEEFHR
jgi:hypothetical protein